MNAVVSLVLKSLSFVNPVYSLIKDIKYSSLVFTNSFDKLISIYQIFKCSTDYKCAAIEALSQLSLLINISIPFFFFKAFDLNFSESFKNIFKLFKAYLLTKLIK